MAVETELAIILHADVVGSTLLVQQDERIAHEHFQTVFRLLSETVAAFGGTTREIRGDALVAQFDRASDGVAGALEFQEENASRNAELPESSRPFVRIGISLGEVIIADQTVTGAGVVLAQRLEQMAEPGGVVVQGAVYETVPKRLPVEFENLGDVQLKGFDEPVRAYSARARPGVQSRAPAVRASPDAPGMRPGSEFGGVHGPRLAIPPFRNLSPDPDQAFFADGLSEEITLALSASRSFPVLASSASVVMKDRTVPVGEAAKALGAQYVLDGSVQRAGNKLRVSVELVNVETQLQVWAERYDRSIEDLFEVQDDITTAVAAVVEPEIDAQEMRRVLMTPPSSLNSYEFAQRGFWHLSKKTSDDYKTAQPLFNESLKIDPRFARGYAGLAQGKYTSAVRLWEDAHTAFGEALDFSLAALDLDQRDPRALRYFGGANIELAHYDEGLQALRQAITVQPSYATAYSGLSFALNMVGDFEGALAAYATTERLRPGDRSLHTCMLSKAIASYAIGDYETSENVSRESIRLTDSFWMSHILLAASLGQRGKPDDAQPAINKAASLMPKLDEVELSKLLPFRERTHFEHLIEGLNKARIKLG